jgi:hypothetical protein
MSSRAHKNSGIWVCTTLRLRRIRWKLLRFFPHILTVLFALAWILSSHYYLSIDYLYRDTGYNRAGADIQTGRMDFGWWTRWAEPPASEKSPVDRVWRIRSIRLSNDVVSWWPQFVPYDLSADDWQVAWWEKFPCVEVSSNRFDSMFTKSHAVTVALWLPMSMALCAAIMLECRWRLPARRRRRRALAGLCAACGYDLRGSVGRCPECGTQPVNATGTGE